MQYEHKTTFSKKIIRSLPNFIILTLSWRSGLACFNTVNSSSSLFSVSTWRATSFSAIFYLFHFYYSKNLKNKHFNSLNLHKAKRGNPLLKIIGTKQRGSVENHKKSKYITSSGLDVLDKQVLQRLTFSIVKTKEEFDGRTRET